MSVLLPVYNGEAYVREAIESVLAQDYPNFELIIVDNASTDATAKIIADYSDDGRIKVIRNPQTLPRLDNFVKAFASASAESSWFKFIGDDDRLLPGCLKEMVAAGEKDGHVGLVCSQYYNGEDLVTGAVPEDVTVIRGAQILRKMLLDPKARATIFSPTAVLISPEVYREMDGFRTDLLHADAELFYRILNKYDLAYIHKPLTCIGYHSASGQAESTASGFTFAEAYLIRYHNLKLYDNVKLNRFEVEKIKNNLVNDSAGFMLARTAKGDFKTAFGHLAAIPLSAMYHLPLSLIYFISLAVKKIIRREPINLLANKRTKNS